MLRYPKPTTTATTAVAATARRGKKKKNNSNNKNYAYDEVSTKKHNNSKKRINTDNKTLRVQYVLDPNDKKKHRKEYDICDTTCSDSNTVIQTTIDRPNSTVSCTNPILMRNNR